MGKPKILKNCLYKVKYLILFSVNRILVIKNPIKEAYEQTIERAMYLKPIMNYKMLYLLYDLQISMILILKRNL